MTTFDKSSLILITGSSGMVGSAVLKLLESNLYKNVLTPSHRELDLCNEQQVNKYFDRYRPEYVMMIAAKVGGIEANRADPVGFLSQNSRMQINLFEACYKYGVKKNLFMGSSCVYPRDCLQPMKEEYLFSGALEPTNEGYALAKIMGLKLAQYYYYQFGMITVCPMPCNIYGTNDTFDLRRAHVLSALVRRFVDASNKDLEFVTLWGTGIARREFIHVSDVAQAALLLMRNHENPDIINIGTGKDISIHDLAHTIAKKVGYKGDIRWDSTKPDGMIRKCLDITKLTNLGFRAIVPLELGIDQTIQEYRELRKAGEIS